MWDLTLRQFVALTERRSEERCAADRRAGQIVAMLYNINRDQKKDPAGATWLDFYPEWNEPTGPQTEEQMLDAMMMWVRATGKERN